MNRIQGQTVRLTQSDEDEYQLKIRIIPVIPSLAGRHYAAKPASLVRVSNKAPVATGGLRETYGVTEEDAARAGVAKVEEFLEVRSKAAKL